MSFIHHVPFQRLGLPPIQLKYHQQAKRLKLAIVRSQIRLTVPSCCSQQQINQFLVQSENWLIQTWNQQQLDRTLPTQLQFFNLKNAVIIFYTKQKELYHFDLDENKLLIDQTRSEQALKQFIFDYAKKYLTDYLQQLSQEISLSFNKSNIRMTKTGWGSCSAQKNIMLHAGLVLFEQNIVRYVCIHELVHTLQMNHSAAFWAEVEKHDSLFKIHSKFLKNNRLPFWMQE